MDEVIMGQVSLGTSVFPCQLPSHQYTLFIHISAQDSTAGTSVPAMLRSPVPPQECCNNNNNDDDNDKDNDDDDDDDNNNNNNNNQNAAQVLPLVISSTGVIPKSLSQSLKRLNLHPNTYIQMQKSLILGKYSIARNFAL